MNKDDFKELSQIRLEEAEILLKKGYYSGAYYLAGYSVECALKGVISKFTNENDFPDKAFANKIYTHNLEELIKHSRLKNVLDNEILEAKEFAVNWNYVKDWSENSRYEIKNDEQAHDLYDSITNEPNGILKWIQKHW